MSLFAELKRRNVIKVALAYVVAAWLTLQITDVLMSVLGLSESAGKFVFLLLVIGFIPVLVFAWAFEVTPEGIKRESEVDRSVSMTRETSARLNRITIGLLIAVAAMVLVDRFVPESSKPAEQSVADVSAETPADADADHTKATTVVTTTSPTVDSTPSVAVLPFVNMSSDEENEYFSDGITEELLNLLVRIEGLRVPSRTSSFAFKGRNTDIKEIARQLDVNHVLEGSVRKADNQLRITAQLIDVTTDTHLWSETYDRELENVFAIQDEIAGNIVNALQLTLTSGLAKREDDKPTDNIEAYNLYLQGLYQFRRRYESVVDAERSLRQAVELDPEFAEAWAVLGLTYTVQPNYIFRPLKEVEPLALEAAARAEALKPSLVEPQLIRGNIAGKNGNVLESIKAYERSVESHPDDALARLWLGIGYLMGGYLQEATQQFDISRKQDPAAGITADWHSRTYYMLGETETAISLARQGLALDRPASAIVLMHHAFDEGTQSMPVNMGITGNRLYWESWDRILRFRDDPEQRAATIAWAETLESDSLSNVAWAKLNVYQFLGEPSDYLAVVANTISQDATIYANLWWPNMKQLRADTAFRVFAREHGLLELWQSRGWPDLCRPVGADDFECD